MEDISRPMALNADAKATIEELRAGADPCRLYHQTAAGSEEMVRGIGLPLLESAGLRLVHRNEYAWYLRELSRLLRTRHGPDLAFHIELCLRKWQGLGLEPNTLQILLTEVYKRVKPPPRPGLSGDMTETSDVSDRVPLAGTVPARNDETRSPNDSSSPSGERQEPNSDSAPAPVDMQSATCNLQSELPSSGDPDVPPSR